MAEWSKARDSKSRSRVKSGRGFKSLPLRNKMVKIKTTLSLLFIFSLSVLAQPLTLKKRYLPPNQTQIENLGKIIKKFTQFKSYRNPNIRRFDKGKGKAVDTVKVLALRVEFQEDFDTLTTGNGKMDLRGFLTPEDGLFYDPPHTKKYFERQLEALRNYFLVNSYGRLYVDFKVMPEGVLDCYQLPQTMLYYGDSMHKYPYNDFSGVEMGLCRLFEDAVRIADRDTLIHWRDYDFLLIFHAGSCNQTDVLGNSPFDLYAATIGSSALNYYLGKDYILTDEGTRIEIATILPEMARQDTARFGEYGMEGLLGLLVHEFCHLLGAYDLYDVSGYSMGVGAWSLMGYGGWLGDYLAGAPPGSVPGLLDPFHKVLFRWVEPMTVVMPKESIPIFCQEMDSSRFKFLGDSLNPVIIKIPITETEYFLIENRQVDVKKKDTIVVDREDGVLVRIEDGEYDFFLPGSGILIWHIDEAVIAQYGPYNAININPSHKGVDLVEGDGIQDFDGWFDFSSYEFLGSKYDPFFIGGFLDTLTPNSNPNSDGYFGKTFYTIKVNSDLDSLFHSDTIMSISFRSELFRQNFPRALGISPSFLNCADLNQDGKIELLVQDTLGDIYAFTDNGNPYGDVPFAYINCRTKMPFAIGDVSGDEGLEVISGGERGRVVIFSATGVNLREFSTRGPISSPIVLFDLNRDGKKEIFFGSEDMYLYGFTGEGDTLPGFPFFLSSPPKGLVIFDSLNPKIFVLTEDNYLHIIEREKIKKSLSLASRPFPPPSPPVAGDLDLDGKIEIAVLVAEGMKYKLLILSDTGAIKSESRPVIDYPSFSFLALSDVDGDGYLDILLSAKNKIYAFSGLAFLVKNYPVIFDSVYLREEIVSGWIITEEIPFIFQSSPVVGDVDGDGSLDIIIGSPDNGILGINGKTGEVARYFPLMTSGPILASPLLLDFENDGKLEMAVVDDNGYLYVYNLPLGNNSPWGKVLLSPDNNPLFLVKTGQIPVPSGKLLEEFYLYPNPCGNEGYLRLKTGKVPLRLKWKVLDITGEPVKDLAGEITLSSLLSQEITISTKLLASGVYILKLEVEGEKSPRFYKFGVLK